jgi:hypothetical protein
MAGRFVPQPTRRRPPVAHVAWSKESHDRRRARSIALILEPIAWVRAVAVEQLGEHLAALDSGTRPFQGAAADAVFELGSIASR